MICIARITLPESVLRLCTELNILKEFTPEVS